MKKYIAILASALLVAISCEKSILDKKPYDAIGGEYVTTTAEGMELLLNGAYDLLSSSYYYGSLLYLYEASKGPDFFVRNVSGGYSFYIENRYAESSTLNGNCKNLWSTIYSVIRNTTILIENIDNVAGNVRQLRRIKGEAYVLRGLAYFDLCRLFAYPPKFSCTWGSSYSDSFKWGVPIIESVEMGTDIFDYEVRRSTADVSWAYIRKQLEMGYGLLQGQNVEQGHVGPAAALALLVRCCLYMEEYSDVISLGEQWIDLYEGDYSLIPYDNYPSMYSKAFNSESIWELRYTEMDNLSSYSLNYWVRKPTYNTPGEEKDGKVSENVGYAKLGLTFGKTLTGLESMNSYSADVRRYLVCEMGIEGYDYHTIRKYVGNPYHFLHNVPVVRLPEIYLSLSEAYWQMEEGTQAVKWLAKLTLARRQAEPTISSVNQILNERRRELILEGHTYWDWFRNGRNISGRPVIESIASGSTISFGSVSGRSYRVVYPIPLAEMNANPAIRDQQNPGYADWQFGVEDE